MERLAVKKADIWIKNLAETAKRGLNIVLVSAQGLTFEQYTVANAY